MGSFHRRTAQVGDPNLRPSIKRALELASLLAWFGLASSKVDLKGINGLRLLLIEFLLLPLLCQLLDSLKVFRVHAFLMNTFLTALSHGGIISSGCRIILRLVLCLPLLLRVRLLSLSGL